MNWPLISLILISYNHEKYVDDCFQAVLGQSYENIEILYLDDASTDASFEKVLKYKEELENKYNSVSMKKNTVNRGVVSNLNECIKKAKGEYVKFLAVDDFLLINTLEVMACVLEKNRTIDVVYSNTISVDENDRFFDYKNVLDKENVITKIDEAPFIRLYDSDYIMAPTLMIRKRIFEKIGYYDTEIKTEDWDFLLRASKVSDFIFVCEPLVAYRYVSSSFSHSNSPEKRMAMKKSELQIIEKHKNHASSLGIDVSSRMRLAFNEAFADAFYIKDENYLNYLRDYLKRNHIRYSIKNIIKNYILLIKF